MRLRVAAQMPAGDPGVAQGVGHAVPVPGGAVQDPGLVEVGEGLAGAGRALVGHADLVEGLGLARAGRPATGRSPRLPRPGGSAASCRPVCWLTALSSSDACAIRAGSARSRAACRARVWAAIASSQYALISRKSASTWVRSAHLRFHSCRPACWAACRMLRHSASSQAAASSCVPSAGPTAAGDRDRHPAPERVQHPVGPVGGVQVVVEQPADGLPLRGLGIVARGAHGRVAADEVVEPELAVRGRGQQVMIQQGGEGLLRLGEGGSRPARPRPAG